MNLVLAPELIAKVMAAGPETILLAAKNKILETLAEAPTPQYLDACVTMGYSDEQARSIWRHVLLEANLIEIDFGRLVGGLDL